MSLRWMGAGDSGTIEGVKVTEKPYTEILLPNIEADLPVATLMWRRQDGSFYLNCP